MVAPPSIASAQTFSSSSGALRNSMMTIPVRRAGLQEILTLHMQSKSWALRTAGGPETDNAPMWSAFCQYGFIQIS